MDGDSKRTDDPEARRAPLTEPGDAESRKRADRRSALALAALPLAFLALLAIVNPNYLESFFDAGPICGSISLGLILVLVLLSYPAVRGSLSVARSGRPWLGGLLVLPAIGLLVAPAILVLLLTPSAIQIMQAHAGGVP